MPKRIEDLLKKYRAEVENVTESKVKKVILYGSYARGDFRADSDIDVMILVDTDRTEVSLLEKKYVMLHMILTISMKQTLCQ